MAQLVEIEHWPIRLTARGEWLHGNEPLHPRVATLFAHSLVPELDGGYRIQLGYARQPVEVEDTAYHVRSVDLRRAGPALQTVMLHLSDGAVEPLDAASLMQSAQHVLYCRIERHGMAVPVRFTPQQYHMLGMDMEPMRVGFGLRLGGQMWPLGPYVRRPAVLSAESPQAVQAHRPSAR